MNPELRASGPGSLAGGSKVRTLELWEPWCGKAQGAHVRWLRGTKDEDCGVFVFCFVSRLYSLYF